MKEASEMLRIGWDALDGIRSRSVARGLARRSVPDATRMVRYLSIDETSFAKRHEYFTVVTDQESGALLHVSDGHSSASIAEYLQRLAPAQKEAILFELGQLYLFPDALMLPTLYPDDPVESALVKVAIEEHPVFL